MTIKQCFTIKDEILNDEHQVFGQSGCLQTDDEQIMLLDFAQMGQYILENCVKQVDDNSFTVSEHKLAKASIQWSREISDMILDNIFENAISDAKDDEEIKLTK